MADGQGRRPTGARPASRRRIVLMRLMALGMGACLALVLAEVLVRLLTDSPPVVIERDPRIGGRFLQSFAADLYDREADRRIAVRFNSEGFRGPDRPRAKPAGVKRVAVLGDSMIAALGVDEPDTLVARLESLLNESPQTDPSERWEVLNFGVNGASPGQELVLYREVVATYEPDVVLCAFFVRNDVSDSSSRLSSNPRIYFDLDESGELRQEPYRVRRSLVSRWLNRYSRFYGWQRIQLSLLRGRAYYHAGAVDPGEWAFCAEPPADVEHAWNVAERVLGEMRREVEGRGARFGVVTIPCGEQVYDDAFQELVRRGGERADRFDAEHPDRRLDEICRRQGAPRLDMLSEFRAAAPSASVRRRDEWLFHHGVGHFNERGNEIAAHAVHRFLVDRLLRSDDAALAADVER